MANRQRQENFRRLRAQRQSSRVAFLFGAGASFGAGGKIVPSRPPLGDMLYADLVNRFPTTWGSLPNETAQSFNTGGFEAGMVALLTAGYPPESNRLLLDMAHYFASYTFVGGSSFYHEIATLIRNHQAADWCTVASLNYECLFEIAAGTDVGLPIVYDEIDEPNSLVTLKPHGSCNFLPALSGNSFINVGIAGHANVGIYKGPICAVSTQEVIKYIVAGESIPPAMSFYAPGKHSPVGADAIAKTRQLWTAACESAEVVLVVGCRPLQADEHLFRPIINCPAKVYMVGGRDGDEFDSFEAAVGAARFEYIGDRCDESGSRVMGLLDEIFSKLRA